MNNKYMYLIPYLSMLLLSSFFSDTLYAEDRIDLETTIIKGNTELPQILYVVPWKENKAKASNQQKLILHSLFGDLLDPQSPASIQQAILSTTDQHK